MSNLRLLIYWITQRTVAPWKKEKSCACSTQLQIWNYSNNLAKKNWKEEAIWLTRIDGKIINGFKKKQGEKFELDVTGSG